MTLANPFLLVEHTTIAKPLRGAEVDTYACPRSVCAQQYGSNRKVGNLINMLPFAPYENLVITDRDTGTPT